MRRLFASGGLDAKRHAVASRATGVPDGQTHSFADASRWIHLP
ncbi:MAG: hypothetical protein U0Q11_22785 [Vicinamibacterales bacterium]